jgi:ATP synthase protein I
MNTEDKTPKDDLVGAVGRRVARWRRARKEGPPTVGSQLGQIGVLGWIVITPALGGLFLGRWLDRMFEKGIFWSASLLFLGIAVGFWSAWRWMQPK